MSDLILSDPMWREAAIAASQDIEDGLLLDFYANDSIEEE